MEVLGFPAMSPASIILQHLRRHGQTTIKELEHVLGVSTTAVREHLSHLQSQGFVTNNALRYGPGRPRLVYTLTDKAEKLFPKQYDLLINVLLQEISATEGREKVEELLHRVSTRLADEYADRINTQDVKTRLVELRKILEDKGIPSEVQPSGSSIEILSCPYRDVAQEHTQVCSMERHMFEQVLGKKITQEQSILDGDHLCCFQIEDTTIAG